MVGTALLTSFFMLTGLGLIMILLGKTLMNLMVDRITRRLMEDPYPENLLEMANVITREGFRNIMETDLRATFGEPLERPFGASHRRSPWEELMFNPVYLSRLPLEESTRVEVSVKLGPCAKKPLTVEIPIVIGGMAYGIGLSEKARLALAQAAEEVGTAVNTGVGPLLGKERKRVKRLILQYHRGSWGKDDKTLKQADMIEIQLGYGALGSAPITLSGSQLSDEFRDYMQLGRGEKLVLGAQLTGVNQGKDLTRLVRALNGLTDGVPIGVKIGATHHLERELEILIDTGLDFLAIDGAEAGVNVGASILLDDTGLPTLPALCRTVKFLERHRMRKTVSLIISGGLVTPGDYLKAIALGADAVAIGTIALMALVHTQMTKAIPWEPPTGLVYEIGVEKDQLSVEESAASVSKFLRSCRQEMELAMRSMGKRSLAEITPEDLTALSRDVAEMSGVDWGWFNPDDNKKGKSRR